MKVEIRYFASLRETLRLSGESVDTLAVDVAGLRRELIAKGGAYTEVLAPGRAVRVAVNQVMAHEGTALSEACEVGFFPPVTGG